MTGQRSLGTPQALEELVQAHRSGDARAVQALQSATITAARLMRQEAHIGQLVRGAFADLLVVEGDPTQGLQMLAAPQQGIVLLMQGGRIVRNALAA